MKSKKKIVFFYPSYVVGGAEYLIIRLFEELSSDYRCYIVDFKNGIYRKLSNKINDNNLIKFKRNFLVPKDAYIITYPNEINRLLNNLNIQNDSNKVLFWAVHPDNFQSLIPLQKYLPNFTLKKFFYPLISKIIIFLNSYNSLLVMDGAILERYKQLYQLDIKLPFCPIPINVKSNNVNIHKNIEEKVNKSNKFKCVWLGRISEEKVYSLKKVLVDISLLKNINIEFDIIGTGKYEYIIREFASSSPFKINFLGTITKNLDDLLINYDVCFGMGTSILESAKLKVPSVLVDPSYIELPFDYKYRWIYETNDYILGRMFNNQVKFGGNLDMKNIFDLLKINSLEIGEKCYEYVKKNNSLENISKKLISYMNQSSLTVRDLRKLNNILFYKVYNKIHKVLKFAKGR